MLSFLKKKGAQQQKKVLIKMCEDAAAGMAYLEGENCIHRWVTTQHLTHDPSLADIA